MNVPLDTPFANLTDAERRAVLAWARSHDWGGDQPAQWHSDASFLWVYGAEHTTEAGWQSTRYVCRTFRELRDWAGY